MNPSNMQVDVVGSQGAPIVLVHGLGGSSSVWWPQVMALRGQHRLVLPEWPGSARSPLQGPLSIERLVEALVGVLDRSAVGPATFVGHSMGTLVLQHFAAAHPARVQRLILVGPTRAPVEPARKAMRDRAAKVRAEGMGPLSDQLMASAISQLTRDQSPVAVAFVRETLLRQTPEGYAQTCEALASAADAALDRIGCPTLLLAGEFDGARPIAEALSREIVGARLEVIAGSGHWLSIEQPEAVTARMIAFLEATP